jgi:antitoxin (DNA-binding transcriptional repressor) of toxin-antitoxin stability system
MRNVKIAEAKNNLSRHLAFVRKGGRVRIFDRDTPIAELVPIEAATSGPEDEEAVVASLDRRGIIRRGNGGTLPGAILKAGPADSKQRLLSALLDERRTGR